MKFLHRTLNHLRALRHRKQHDADLAEELRLHLEQRTEENIAAGMSPEEARHAAQRRFGGMEQVKERCRDQQRWAGLEQFAQDLRFAVRSLLRTPGFTAVAVVTLALGIGLNSAMFSLANVALLRPLPFAEPSELVQVYRTSAQTQRGPFSAPDFFDLRQEQSSFGRFAAYYYASVGLAEPGQPPEWQNTLRVSADFFEVVGQTPLMGRTFRAEEEFYGSHRVVVLAHALWQERFGGAPDIVGRTLRLNGEPYEVIGVMPATAHDQRMFGNARIFRPLGLNERERARRDIGFLGIIGRRAAGVSVAQGEAFVAASGERAAAEFPKENARSGRRAVELQASLRKPPVPALVLLLLGLSTAVLLIACSNLANFLLARAIARTRESAVRTALGASRLQLIRPLAVEALVLAGLGGAGALLVMHWTSAWFNAELARVGDSPMAFTLDWRVLGFTFGVSALTILFFGLGPAIFTSRIDPEQALKSGSRSATPGRRQQRFRYALIVGQFALATVLVAGAGLFLRGADNLLRADHGWDANNVVQGYFQLPASSYRAEAKIAAFQHQALERLNQIPGVTAASLSYGLPYRGLGNTRRYVAEGAAAGAELAANVNGVSPAYFAATGTRLLRGRAFGAADTPASPRVAIVSEGFARALFGGENPLGRRVATPGTAAPEWREIVGVVADISPAVADGRAETAQLYEPLAQDNWYTGDGRLAELYLAVRHAGVTPEAAIAGVRAALLAIDPDLPVRNLLPATTLVERAVGALTLLQKLLTGFALLGLLLAALGLYGTIARAVAQRTAEIGIRMALGAQVRDVTRLVLGGGLRLALVGAGLGLLGAVGLVRLIVAMFPALRTDPALVLAGAVLVLSTIAFLACYLPARAAAQINPLTALRSE